MRKNFIVAVSGLLFLAILILIDLAGDLGRLGQGIDNLLTFTGESMWPPNWSVLETDRILYVEGHRILLLGWIHRNG